MTTCRIEELNDVVVDDHGVKRIVLTSSGGLEVTIFSYGATISSIKAASRQSVMQEVTLGYRDITETIRSPYGAYFGCIVGRFANRIRRGHFELDGETYNLAINNGVNALHGGIVGFNKKNWSIIASDTESVTLSITSNDGEEGYPGNMTVIVKYLVSATNDLSIFYEASTDKATPINLTNHTYFNLSGDLSRKINDHRLHLSSCVYLPVDDTQIPTGELKDAAGSPFDLAEPKILGPLLPQVNGGGKDGFDHCFIVDTSSQVGQVIVDDFPVVYHMATLSDDASGRQLIVKGSQPGIQVYTGNFLTEDESAAPFIKHNAICLETQHFPDSVNQPNFPSTILRPGEKYRHISIFSFRLTPS